MKTLFEMSKAVAEYKQQNRYTEALLCFKQHKMQFSKEQLLSNPYLIANIIHCLRKDKQFEAISVFAKIYGIDFDNKVDYLILNAYSWVIYDLIQSGKYPTPYPKLISVFRSLCSSNHPNSQNTLSILFNVFVKSEKLKQNHNYEQIQKVCQSVDPNLLSTQSFKAEIEIKNKTKNVDMASPAEKWYSLTSKTYFELGQYQECIKNCDSAFSQIKEFHFSNNHWLMFRKAQCYGKLSKPDEALKLLFTVYTFKKDWFVEKQIAESYFQMGNFEQSKIYLFKAFLNFGELKYKGELILLLSEMFKIEKEPDLSLKALLLYKLVRENSGWKCSYEIGRALESMQNSTTSIGSLKNELKQIATDYLNGLVDASAISAYVQKIINSNERGANGFLKTESGKIYYFVANPKVLFKKQLQVGTKVLCSQSEQMPNGKTRVSLQKILE
jgi:tetratricopeptide (TPR) repeat protein